MELSDVHFRLLVEEVQDYAIYLLDPDGIVRSWNAGAARLKGYEADEIVGRPFSVFFSDEDRAAGRPQDLLREALAAGRAEDHGWRVRKDGSQFWANALLTALHDADGRHFGFAKITRDLTDRSYRSFVEASHAIVWTTDAEGDPNADSESWRAFTGQSREEWRGRTAWDAVHPEDRPRLEAAWSSARATGSALRAEVRLRRHDGAYVWMGTQAVPLFARHGRVREWFGVALDISGRKRAEAERERATELWQTTLRSIGDAVIATDAGGVVTFMNPVAERLTAWTSGEAAGRSLRDVFPIYNEETGASVENPVDKVLREGVVVGLANHTVLRSRRGDLVPIDDSAAPILRHDGAIDGVVLVFRDASEEKLQVLRRSFLAAATEDLIGAEDYGDALRRIAHLAVPRLADWATVDVLDGDELRQLALAHVDPAKVEAAREIARRYPSDPAATRGVWKVIRTGEPEFHPEISETLIEAGARDDEHARLLRELHLRSAIIVPLRAKHGVFGAISLILAEGHRRYTARDVELAEELARRAALVIERRRLEEEAATANRMKDEFLAIISHELRTPLQAILGYGSMLERGVARDPAKALDAILRNATTQARLVEDILDMSRIMSGKLDLRLRRVDLGSAIRAAMESLRPAAVAKAIALSEDVPVPIEVRGDLDRLQQIVSNLVSNGIKFTDPGGSVAVGAHVTDRVARVTVRDTGRGIPPAFLSSIFERFRQVDSSVARRQGGLGLGLSIVRHLVDAHGGMITAHSDGEGRGATFAFTIPLAAEDTPSDSDGVPAWQSGTRSLRAVTVLLVEDDPDSREMISELLMAAGAEVTTAADAAIGFERLRQAPPQVLLSDIGLPGEDGFSFIRRVRALPPESGGDVPAIALTAHARPEDIRHADEAGFQLHVSKPVRADALVHAVESCVRRET
jgi:PAS domain S-box-containing protein